MEAQWARCKVLLSTYSTISGARLNMDKTVGLAVGPATQAPLPPPDPDAAIQWLTPGQGERYLGARMGVEIEDDLEAFWLGSEAGKLGIIPKVRQKAVSWQARHLSYTGRVLVGRTCVSSLIWYYHTTMATLAKYLSLVSRVMWEFLWGRPISELDSSARSPAGMCSQATASLRKAKGGLNAQDVRVQARATSAGWIARLLCGGMALWTCLAWHFLFRVGERWDLRDRVLYSPNPALARAAKNARIPCFWRESLQAWWELGIQPIPVPRREALTPHEVAAEPIRYSRFFSTPTDLADRAESRGFHRVGDLWNYRTGEWRTAAQLSCRGMLTQAGGRLRQDLVAHVAATFPPELAETLSGGRPHLRHTPGDVVSGADLEVDLGNLDPAPAQTLPQGYHACGVVTGVEEGGVRVTVVRAYHLGWGSRLIELDGAPPTTVGTRDLVPLVISEERPKGGQAHRAVRGPLTSSHRGNVNPDHWGWQDHPGGRWTRATGLTVKKAYGILTGSAPPPACQVVWEGKFPTITWQWPAIWSRVWDNPYGVPFHQDFQWKVLHRPNNLQWLCRQGVCPNPGCAHLHPEARGLRHFLSGCPVTAPVWEWLARVWAGVTGHRPDLSPPHCFTGIPHCQGVPLEQMDSPVWRALHTTTLYHIWCAWTAWIHEEVGHSPQALWARIVASVSDRIPVLHRKAMLQDRVDRGPAWAEPRQTALAEGLPDLPTSGPRGQCFVQQWTQHGLLATYQEGEWDVHLPDLDAAIPTPAPTVPVPTYRPPRQPRQPRQPHQPHQPYQPHQAGGQAGDQAGGQEGQAGGEGGQGHRGRDGLSDWERARELDPDWDRTQDGWTHFYCTRTPPFRTTHGYGEHCPHQPPGTRGYIPPPHPAPGA